MAQEPSESRVEARAIPELALTAARLAKDQYHRLVNEIAAETLEAMGLSARDGWVVDFGSRQAVRQATE